MKLTTTACLLAALFLIAEAALFSEDHYKTHFVAFMKHHGRSYGHEEFKDRYEIFKDNYDYIAAHNQKGATFTLALNRFADHSFEEFKINYLGLSTTKKHLNVGEPLTLSNSSIPSSWDWRVQGAVTEVKDQGQCGSCWSFSTTGSVEGCHFLANKELVSLSEQNLIDCSFSYGNQGCNGGLMTNAMQYIISNGGIDTEQSYPYTATDNGKCAYTKKNRGATLKSFHNIKQGDEQQLLEAAVKGPVSIAIDASQRSFQFYSSGVYNEPACSSENLDHGVLLVGWGTAVDGGDYWIVKNSWSATWGQEGYILMSRNKNNQCGVATMATLPSC